MGNSRSVEDVQLQQQCDNCKRSENIRVIGKLSFCWHCIPNHSDFLHVYIGKFERKVVAVKILLNAKTKLITTTVESETLRRVVVRHYITEQDDDFWYVNLSYETKDNIIKIRN